MAPVANLYRLAFGGRLMTNESWSCSMHIHSPVGLNLAASNFDVPIKAWMIRPSSMNNAGAALDFVKFNQINPLTGKYVLPSSNTFVSSGAIGIAFRTPGQLSLAVTLGTALSRGRGHAGRFYPPSGLPTSGSACDALGKLPGADVTGCVTSAQTLIDGINAVAVNGKVVVFSKIGQSVENVTSIRVGHIMDTMRSRRRSLPEEYISGVVTA